MAGERDITYNRSYLIGEGASPLMTLRTWRTSWSARMWMMDIRSFAVFDELVDVENRILQ